MCGILGFYAYNSNNISPYEFDNFVDSLAHRGPDGRGIYYDQKARLFLGHRRLKILDLSDNGKQPMSYLNERFLLTFNGEIYNFLELREELKKNGYHFKSETDAEIVLASYAKWGNRCLDKFNGMWAFAIWDKYKRELFFSRDRFGVKPFYFFFNEYYFAFASELKAFLSLPMKFDFDNQEVANAIHYANFMESKEKTILKDVYRLLPGHSGTFSFKEKLQIFKWWKTSKYVLSSSETFSDQIDHFYTLFEDACKIRMRSDVPFGTALSGGLDSSSILALISKIKTSKSISKERQLQTKNAAFVISYLKSSQDELEYANQMIKDFNPVSFIQTVNPKDLLKYFDKVLFSIEGIFDLPIGPWLVYKNFREKKYYISIDGHGADEMLGGYYHHVETMIIQNMYSLTKFKKK